MRIIHPTTFPKGKLPKPFTLLATRKGEILAQFVSGKIVEILPA